MPLKKKASLLAKAYKREQAVGAQSPFGSCLFAGKSVEFTSEIDPLYGHRRPKRGQFIQTGAFGLPFGTGKHDQPGRKGWYNERDIPT